MMMLILVSHMVWITSSFSTLPFLNFTLLSLSLYRSCISQMLSSTYWFPRPLYTSNSLANILWIRNTQSSMLLWIRYYKSSDIPRILVVFMVQLLILTFRIVSFISIIIILVSPAIFIIPFTCLCTSIIASNPFNILWYTLV